LSFACRGCRAVQRLQDSKDSHPPALVHSAATTPPIHVIAGPSPQREVFAPAEVTHEPGVITCPLFRCRFQTIRRNGVRDTLPPAEPLSCAWAGAKVTIFNIPRPADRHSEEINKDSTVTLSPIGQLPRQFASHR